MAPRALRWLANGSPRILLERRLKQAGFRDPGKTLGTFDFNKMMNRWRSDPPRKAIERRLATEVRMPVPCLARWMAGILIPLAMIGGACGRSAHLTAMKNRRDDPPQLMPMSVRDMIALPRFPRAYTRQQLAEIAALEGRGVTVEGFVARLRQMTDGDYHIQITEAPIGPCLDHDTPDQLITELTPGIRARKPRYTWEKLLRLCGSGSRVRLVGWLLFDSSRHAQDQDRSTPWEVHPITRIEVCCWRELD